MRLLAQLDATLRQLDIPYFLVSAEGLTILKFVAWADNGIARDGRDAQDLLTILRNYRELLGLDALYDQHFPILEAYGLEDQRAAAHVLGVKVAQSGGQQVRALITKQLELGHRDRLVSNMARGQHLINLDSVEDLLAAFEAGLIAGT